MADFQTEWPKENVRLNLVGWIKLTYKGWIKRVGVLEKKFTVASKTFFKIPQNIVPNAFQHLVKKFGSLF